MPRCSNRAPSFGAAPTRRNRVSGMLAGSFTIDTHVWLQMSLYFTNLSSVLGLWKKVYYAGGVLNDVGFNQFNAGGTELLNDSPVPDGGNNFCMARGRKS